MASTMREQAASIAAIYTLRAKGYKLPIGPIAHGRGDQQADRTTSEIPNTTKHHERHHVKCTPKPRKRKCAPNVKARRKKRQDDKEVPARNVAAKGAQRKPVKLVKDSRKGDKEQAKGVMKTKRRARNVPKAVGIRVVKLTSVAMKRKLVKKSKVKSRRDV
ncbi:hypothetical protein ZWY2020_005185 [Hordeum vulgare]|nr:hypothetical protein ZWY2020_005185 [Hordeum vulgare]